MATKVICIIVAAIVIVAFLFLVDKFLPRKDEDESNSRD